MLSKKVLKDIQSLSLKKFRDESGLFVAEGPKIVGELLTTVPQNIEAIYAVDDFGATIDSEKLHLISDMELQKISGLQTPNKVVAVLKQFPVIDPPTGGFHLYLDRIQDPGNFGTIIRTADWFGVSSIICSSGCADRYNPKVVQSTMASIARVAVYYDEEDNWLQNQQATIYAASLQGESLYDLKTPEQGILIIGNESKGIRESFLALATNLLTIPARGEAESLNAAVATGIILSHLLR